MKKILCFLFVLVTSCTFFPKESHGLTQQALENSASSVFSSQNLLSNSASNDERELDKNVALSLDFFIANTDYKVKNVSKFIENVTYEMRINSDKPFLFDFLEVSVSDNRISLIPLDDYAVNSLYYDVRYLFFISARGNDFNFNVNYHDFTLHHEFTVVENNSEFNYIGEVNSEWGFNQSCILIKKYEEYLEIVNLRWFEKPCSFEETFFEKNCIYLAHVYTTIYIKRISFITFFSCDGWLYAQFEINSNKNVDIDPLSSCVFWISFPKRGITETNSLGVSCYKTEDAFNV